MMSEIPAPFQSSAISAMLGKIPSGLFVLTWRDGETDRGMLASWLMQAGFDPPCISVAIGTHRELLTFASSGHNFVVNILGESQKSILGKFGKPALDGYNPFDGLTVSRSPCGAAVFVGGPGWLECQSRSAMDCGDHSILIATVVDASNSVGEPSLVHLRRNGLRY